MKVKFDINEAYDEQEIIIKSNKMTDEIKSIVDFLDSGGNNKNKSITGTVNDKIVLFDIEEIYRIYAEKGKVFAKTTRGKCELKLRLYEVEEKVTGSDFVRISKSEIINLKKVAYFETSLTGTIEVVFANKENTFVSRRYIKSLKERLGL